MANEGTRHLGHMYEYHMDVISLEPDVIHVVIHEAVEALEEFHHL